ncbi:hypothetical protein E4U55_003831, partial [Claviceps digitariae]
MPSSPSTAPPRSHDDHDDHDHRTRHQDCPLKDLLPLHDDLRTWLDHTSFWDLDYRRGILADVRRLKGLEAERATVLMRIRDSKPADSAGTAAPDSAPPRPAPSMPVPSPARGRPVPPRNAPKKDTRYFLVKSSTMSNVIKSQQD